MFCMILNYWILYFFEIWFVFIGVFVICDVVVVSGSSGFKLEVVCLFF